MIPRSERAVWDPSRYPIGSKSDFRELESRGVLGNRFRTWPNVAAMKADGYTGWVRIAGHQASSEYKVDTVEQCCIQNVLDWLVDEGARLDDLYIGEIPEPYDEDEGTGNQRLINFEVIRTPDYLYLDWGTQQKSLRKDLNDRLRPPATGLNALRILKFYLAEEFDELERLWDIYPSAVIEASCFSKPVGVLNRRLLLWELRYF